MERSRSAALAVLVASAVLVGGLALSAAPAGAEVACTTQDVSPGDNPNAQVISGDGEHVVFLSTRDPLGTNADGSREVFTFDVVLQSLQQVTDLPGGTSIDTGSLTVDGDGGTIGFASTANPTGANPDGNLELFAFTDQVAVPLPILVQLTSTTGGTGSGMAASLDRDGNAIAFTSDRDLDGGNADGNTEVFTAEDLGTGVTIEQVTATTGGGATAHAEVDLAADGTHLAYTSTRNPTGGNADGNAEIFRTVVSSEAALQLTTTTTGTTRRPSINEDGNRIAFESDSADLGTNPDGNAEIYLRRITPGSTSRITNASTAITAPSLSADGEVVAFDVGDAIIRELVADGDLRTVATESAAGVDTDDDGDRFALEAEPGGGEEPRLGLCLDPTFGDVAITHPFVLPIEWMAAEGISTGTPASPLPLYKPSDPVSRGAMSAFMFRLAAVGEFTGPDVPTFTDVGTAHPFFDEIEWMAATGITTGFEPGPTYRPGAAVSRQAMSAFMFRLADQSFSDPAEATFSDVAPGGTFFTEIEWMAFRGITTGFGDGTYRPTAPVSRQAMSAFMQRLGERVPFVPPIPEV